MAKNNEFADKIIGQGSSVPPSTGGGEPIPKGKTRTTEERVLQPRKDNGQFDYNSAGRMSRKYAYHAERNGSHDGRGGGGTYKTVPQFAARLKVAFANLDTIKKGTVIVTEEGKKYILSMDIKKEEFMERLEEYMVEVIGKDKNGNERTTGRFTYQGATKRQSEDEVHWAKAGNIKGRTRGTKDYILGSGGSNKAYVEGIAPTSKLKINKQLKNRIDETKRNKLLIAQNLRRKNPQNI